jgi:hypothetical protein
MARMLSSRLSAAVAAAKVMYRFSAGTPSYSPHPHLSPILIVPPSHLRLRHAVPACHATAAIAPIQTWSGTTGTKRHPIARRSAHRHNTLPGTLHTGVPMVRPMSQTTDTRTRRAIGQSRLSLQHSPHPTILGQRTSQTTGTSDVIRLPRQRRATELTATSDKPSCRPARTG